MFWYDKRYYFTTYEDKLKVYSSAYDYFEDIYEDTVSYTEFNLETAFGEVLGFQNINNSVYVFQEYKISSVSVNNSGKNLRGEITLSSPILNGTICKIGSVVLFMTRGGIYKFTGSSISQIYSDLNHFENFYKLKTVCFNQKYYILISNSPEDSYLYGLDIMSDGISKTRIDGACDIYSVLTPNHNLLSININKNGVFTTKYLNFCENYAGIKFLKFSPMFFENLSAKFLNEIEISCTGSFSLQIKTEFSMTKFNVSGNFKIENLGLLGKVFEFEISSSEDFEIRYISLAVTYCD